MAKPLSEPDLIDARLLVVSAMPHYRNHGIVAGWGPTAEELDHLSALFKSIRHLAVVHDGITPAAFVPYSSANITPVLLPAEGGPDLRHKLKLLARMPEYVRAIWRELGQADVVHVRGPANMALLAMILLAGRARPRRRWIKYAGNWRPTQKESWSYTLQRLWLRRGLARAAVTVNGAWPGDPPHVRPFLNPSLTDQELTDAAAVSRTPPGDAPRLAFVGRLDPEKGARRAVQIAAELRRSGLQATLDIVGDGTDREPCLSLARSLGIEDHVRLHGWMPRRALAGVYRQSDFFVFPSTSSEGWPKVLSEAMAYGVIPLTSDVSAIPQTLESFGVGVTLSADDTAAFSQAVRTYCHDSERWSVESQRARVAAQSFGYTYYIARVRELLGSL
jgi:glycosyltransferase involved in cell wall biosynthesis